MMRILSIGEILWDIMGNVEHLGGAPLNFAAHAAKLGHQTYLLSAIGKDERGRKAKEIVETLGVGTRYLQQTDRAATGVSEVTLDALGQARHNLPRPAAYDFVALSEKDLAEIHQLQLDWICFGTLHHIYCAARELTNQLLEINSNARRFYDINLRPNLYTPELVRELITWAHIVKLNDDEARSIAQFFSVEQLPLEDLCRYLSERFALQAVCVTRGGDGCALLLGDKYVEDPGFRVEVADTVGSGDAFSAGLLHGIDEGWQAPQIAEFANRLGALVASRAGAIPEWTLEETQQLVRRN